MQTRSAGRIVRLAWCSITRHDTDHSIVPDHTMGAGGILCGSHGPMDWQIQVVGARDLQIPRRRRITYRHHDSSPHTSSWSQLCWLLENTFRLGTRCGRNISETIGRPGRIRSYATKLHARCQTYVWKKKKDGQWTVKRRPKRLRNMGR